LSIVNKVFIEVDKEEEKKNETPCIAVHCIAGLGR